MHEQVRELCTNYGKLDLLWFDFAYDSPVNGMKMRGETWRATELHEHGARAAAAGHHRQSPRGLG